MDTDIIKRFRNMIKMKTFFMCTMLFLGANITFAQSVSYAKSLIEQGKYLEAAKQLRPLADGGNAEAQYLAATLFFDGKGVTKNDAQGKKYATLSANQGNEDAMMLLIDKSSQPETFQLAKKYTDQHPYLLRRRVGLFLAECYLSGKGVEQNESLGWEIFERHKDFENLLETDRQIAKGYWNYKSRKASKTCLEDYADYLYGSNREQYNLLLAYLEKSGALSLSSLENKANAGSGWASARLAEYYNGLGNTNKAKDYAQKAANAGSNYGRNLSAEYNYVSRSFTNITTTSRPRNFAIGKVTRNYKTTEVDIVYNNPGTTDWITLSPDIYLSCNGRKFLLVRSSNDLNKRIIVSNRKTYTVTLTFQAIPESTNTFTMIEPNGDTWRDVTFR